MTIYNRILSVVLIIGLLANGCMALALVDEHHRMHAEQDTIAAAIPPQMLMPMPLKHVTPASYVPVPQRKPLVRS